MKSLLLVVVLAASLCGYTQSEKYTLAMRKNLVLLDSSRAPGNFTSVADGFQRIGDAEKTQWLPYYYAGLALSINAWQDQKLDKDANSARIKELCDKAAAINDNAEIYALRNMAATQQMLVDPQNRWQTYGKEAADALKNGTRMDPQNPRLYYLQAASLFNTPEQFGGGKAAAKPVLEKAMQLFAAETVKPLYPNWGKKQTEEMLAQCK